MCRITKTKKLPETDYVVGHPYKTVHPEVGSLYTEGGRGCSVGPWESGTAPLVKDEEWTRNVGPSRDSRGEKKRLTGILWVLT